MQVDTTKSASADSATVEPSTDIDDPANLDFMEPGDEANQEDEQEQESDAETDEAAEDGQEADDETADEGDEAETEAESEEADTEEGEGDEEEAKPVKDDVLVTLSDGEQVQLGELRQGYMRDRDYRHKTTDLSNKRKEVEGLSSRLTNTVNAFAKYLSEQIPDEPNASLLYSGKPEDAATFTRQKAMYDSAVEQINKIVQMGEEPKQVTEQLTEQQRNESLREENAKLVERFPMAAEPEGRKKFFDTAFDAGRELGYSDDEMKGVSDHRILSLAYWAKKGMEADKAREKVKTKVEKAPPVNTRRKAQGKNAAAQRKNRDGMKRLARTGSIHDAMSIDFD